MFFFPASVGFGHFLASVGFLALLAFGFCRLFGFCWLFDSVGYSIYRRMTRNYIEMLALGLRWLQMILLLLLLLVAVVVLLVVVVVVVEQPGLHAWGGGPNSPLPL